jgi:hypothetical protein
VVRGVWTSMDSRKDRWFIRKTRFLFERHYLRLHANICSFYIYFHFVVPRIGSIRGFPNEASSYLYQLRRILGILSRRVFC